MSKRPLSDILGVIVGRAFVLAAALAFTIGVYAVFLWNEARYVDRGDFLAMSVKQFVGLSSILVTFFGIIFLGYAVVSLFEREKETKE